MKNLTKSFLNYSMALLTSLQLSCGPKTLESFTYLGDIFHDSEKKIYVKEVNVTKDNNRTITVKPVFYYDSFNIDYQMFKVYYSDKVEEIINNPVKGITNLSSGRKGEKLNEAGREGYIITESGYEILNKSDFSEDVLDRLHFKTSNDGSINLELLLSERIFKIHSITAKKLKPDYERKRLHEDLKGFLVKPKSYELNEETLKEEDVYNYFSIYLFYENSNKHQFFAHPSLKNYEQWNEYKSLESDHFGVRIDFYYDLEEENNPPAIKKEGIKEDITPQKIIASPRPRPVEEIDYAALRRIEEENKFRRAYELAFKDKIDTLSVYVEDAENGSPIQAIIDIKGDAKNPTDLLIKYGAPMELILSSDLPEYIHSDLGDLSFRTYFNNSPLKLVVYRGARYNLRATNPEYYKSRNFTVKTNSNEEYVFEIWKIIPTSRTEVGIPASRESSIRKK